MKGSTNNVLSKIVYCLFASVLAIAIISHSAWAQTGVGTIAGTVSDQNKAIVPGADLTLTNDDTGVSRKGVTSDEGTFYFAAVPRGQYTLDVELPGFKKWSGKLQLQVGQAAKVDPVLEVGEIQNVVEVTGAVAPISFVSAEVSDVKDYQRIRQLPLNGRSVSTLFDLTPAWRGAAMPASTA